MRIAWVHPSWRDLVIEHLSRQRAARAHFLSACGPDGVSLALAVAGGAAGERTLPLLREDADWDLLTDRVAALIAGLDPPVLTHVLSALEAALAGTDDRWALREARALATYALERIKRGWDDAEQPLDVGLLEAWFDLAQHLPDPPSPPCVARTWSELLPSGPPDIEATDALERYDEWLRLAVELKRSAPEILEELRFPRRYRDVLVGFWDAVVKADPTTVAPRVRSAVLAVIDRYVDVGLFTHSELEAALRPWRENPHEYSSADFEARTDPTSRDDGIDVSRILRDL